jgi:thiol:disulfide interchange protein DsbC
MKYALAALVSAATAVGAGDLSDPAFRAEVAARIPGVRAGDIQPSPVPGIYRARRGQTIAYITADGRYLFDGDLIELTSGENLSDAARRRWRRAALAAVPESSMLIFEPAAPRHTLTVFIDVDCPQCRRLHAAIDRLLAAGIRVRYLFYPLQGPASISFDKAEAVWCADDRRRALTRAMRGEEVGGDTDCETPVMAHLRLAAKTLQLPGTPGLIAGDGRLLSPALTPAELIREMTASP